MLPEPNRAVLVTLIVSPSLAPTWKVIEVEPVRSEMPLNAVVEPMRLISAHSWATSAVMAALSEADRVPLLNCTARSRTR